MSRVQLEHFLNDIALMTDADKADWDVVKLMTVHASKGLEFDYVFVVWLEEWTFPWYQSTLNPDDLEEERRLMYVAMTRAKDHLFLSHVWSRMIWGRSTSTSWSRFLDELPGELVKQYSLGSTDGAKKRVVELEPWSRVRNKLFGIWTIKEVRWDMVIILFDKSSIGLRKMDKRMVEKVLGQ